MKTFLFQGDSITDAGRDYHDDQQRGCGYPTLVAAELGYKYPGVFNFINRGVNGNRIVDLYARIKRDIITLKPDYLTILIGINDVWHELGDIPNGVDNEKFFRVYDMFLEELKAALPKVKIFVLSPFVLKASATRDKWKFFSSEVALRAESAKRAAEKYGYIYVPLQEKFDSACERAPIDFWLLDGVHPAAPGHELIAREIVKAVEEEMKK